MSSSYVETIRTGATDNVLNKKIVEVIIVTDTYYVYLDDSFTVQWVDDSETNINSALNKVAELEVASDFINSADKLQLVRRQVGEGLARALSGYENDSVIMLKIAEDRIFELNQRTSWTWYFISSLIPTALLFLLVCIVWYFRGEFKVCFGDNAFITFLSGSFGVFGAVFSISTRTTSIKLDANFGYALHAVEALARTFVGFFSGVLLSLAILAGIVGGSFLNDGNKLSFFLMACFISGISERLVPNLVSKIENENVVS